MSEFQYEVSQCTEIKQNLTIIGNSIFNIEEKEMWEHNVLTKLDKKYKSLFNSDCKIDA